MNIVLVGGTIEALVLAHHLQEHHQVFLVEIEAELGLPVLHPGRVIQQDVLDVYMTKEQQSFLLFSPNPHGWGCRWDWVLKHLAANVARQGVMCFTRTRILSCTKQGEQYSLELSSSERSLPTHLIADRVVIMNHPHTTGPGRRRHRFQPDQPPYFPQNETAEWNGGTVLSEDAKQAPATELRLERADGLTELWWKGDMEWQPPRGFFESSSAMLSPDIDELSFDGVVSRVLAFLPKVV
jgi:hypothetical protein